MSLFKKKSKDIPFSYPIEFEGKEATATCRFDPSFLKGDGFSLPLCRASLALALASFSSPSEDKAENIKQFLAELGCKDIKANDDYSLVPHPRTIGCAIGKKKLGWRKTLFIVGIRGGAYLGEWGGNFLVGRNGFHEGFDIASEKALKFIESYIAKTKGKKILWTAGYSRGGGVANLLAAKAIDKGLFDEVHCYCFEAPAGGQLPKAKERKYSSIHNIVDPGDLVPLSVPAKFGFARFGIDHYLPDPLLLSGAQGGFRAKEATLRGLWSAFRDAPDDPKNPHLPASYFLRKLIDSFVSHLKSRDDYVDSLQTGLVAFGTLIAGEGNPYLHAAEVIVSLARKAMGELGIAKLLTQGIFANKKLEESLIPIVEKELSSRKIPLDKKTISASIARLVAIVLDVAVHEPYLLATAINSDNLKVILSAHNPSNTLDKLMKVEHYVDEPRFCHLIFKGRLEVYASNKRLYPNPEIPVAMEIRRSVELMLPAGEYEIRPEKKTKITLVHSSSKREEIELSSSRKITLH